MPGKAAKVVLSERQQQVLDQLTRATTAPKRLVPRAHLILLAFQGLHNEDMAPTVGLERHQVGLWRQRGADAFDRLVVIACTQNQAHLRRAIAEVLADAPRPGSPGKFTPEQLAQLIATACEPPEQSGRPIDHWTAREVADEVRQRGIVPSISTSQVGRILAETELQPHRSRSWLNSQPKDPAAFAQHVETVCTTYLEAPRLSAEHGTHTLRVDEKTGIQALERIAATLPPRPGQVERIEFEYERHGTPCLIGNFDVVTGQVLAPTIQETRTEADFVAPLQRTVTTIDADGRFIFVLDNLNIHCSEGLVRWVAQQCGLEADWGVKGKKGLLRSLASRRAFLEDQHHRLGFVYTPKHTSWLNQIELWFGILVRKWLRRSSFASVEELRARILRCLEYFNRTMAKPFRWTYTDRPLTV